MSSHIELDIAERAVAVVPFEAFIHLTDRLLADDVELPYSPALCLAKDIKRQYGSRGFMRYCRLMRKFEPPWGKPDCHWLQCLRWRWEDIDPDSIKGWCDYLLVDALDTARAAGFVHHGAEDILNELAARSGAKRAAIQAQADAEEAIERAQIDAEVAAEFAVYEAWLAAGEPADDPLAEDHRTRKRCILRYQIESEYDAIFEHEALNDDGAQLRTSISEWEARHGGLVAIRRLFLTDKRIPPGSSVLAMEKMRLLFTLPPDVIEKFTAGDGMPISVHAIPPQYHDAMRILTKPLQWANGDTQQMRVPDRETGFYVDYDPWSQPLREQFPIPAEILDMHKRQAEHIAATLLGPLPDHPELPMEQAVSLSRFYAHLPSGKIIYTPTRGLWASASADKHIGPIKDPMNPNGRGKLASTFLSQFRCVQGMGWDPSEPMIIEDRVLTQEGWITSKNDRSFNLYIPPEIKPVEGDVSPWLDHVRRVYPNEAEHIVQWLAHRVQRPGEKVNHALVFIGTEGVGKDTIVEPVVTAIGRTNFASVTAKHFFESDFNGYLRSVMLRIDEVHDLGGESKYAFHDRTKPIIAAPPSAHIVNEKFVPHYVAKNVCGVILTSNHLDALYLSQNDRRHYVCVSDLRKEQFASDYFENLHTWFENGGNEAVAYYLANLDISGFKAKAPPPQTEGWYMLVGAGLAPETGDMNDAIEALGKPVALTLPMIRSKVPFGSNLQSVFDDPKLKKTLPKRLAECGYVAVGNPDARESGGRWRTERGKLTIYGRQDTDEGTRLQAARVLSSVKMLPPPPY